MLLMKLVNRCFLLLTLWLSAGVARAQCTITPNPTGACTFDAFDAAATTGAPITAFCVGRGVRFAPCASRNILPSQVSYSVVRGAISTSPISCPTNPQPYLYTPTRADVGMVTVVELTNNGAGVGVVYTRIYRVYDTPPPTFTVAPCPNGFALVTVTDATYDSYTTGAVPLTRNVGTNVAAVPGQNITVTGHYAAAGLCDISASQLVPTLAPPQVPAFTSLTLQAALPGGAASLAVGQLPAGYLYTLQIADATAPGSFRNLSSVAAGTSAITLPNPTAGCYRIFRNDYCGTTPAASPLICTLSLMGSSTQNRNQLLLTDAGSPGTTYTVTRDGTSLTGFTGIAGGLEDPSVQCGTTYTYVVTATQPGGGRAVSNPIALLTQSAVPPAQPRLVASFNLNDVVLLSPLLATGTLPTGSTLRYSRTAGGKPALVIGSSTTTRPLRDSATVAELLAQPPCYSARVVDVCGNVSPESSAVCPALLTAGPADPDGSTAILTWTPFTGPDPRAPATYVLQRLATDGTELSRVSVSGNSYTDLTPPTDRQVLRYRLQIGGAGLPAGTFSYSNRATVSRRLFLTIPTAFTPNGDGINDVLEVKGKYLQNYLFVVVDRNGQEVFRGTQRSQTWDGTIKGQTPVLGAYIWRFQQNDEAGKSFTATGAITILK